MKHKCALFDIDGTLLNSNWVWNKVDNRCEEILNIEFNKNYKKDISHMHMEEIAEYTIKNYKININKTELIKLWENLAYNMYQDEVTLKEGAELLLQKLKNKGIKLGVVSSCRREICLTALRNNKLIDYFDIINFVEDEGHKKENAKLYLETCKALFVDPQESVIFEDIIKPLISAKKEGFFYIGVYDKYQPKEEIEKLIKNSDYYIKDYNNFLSSKEIKKIF